MSLQPLSLQQKATNENTPCDRLIELSKICTLLTQLVAKNSNAPSKLLRELSNSSDVITRQNVAANPNTPTDVLLNLGGEFPEQLLNNPIFSLSWLENPKLFDVIPQTTLLSLLKQESVPVLLLEWAVHQLDSEVQLVAEEDLGFGKIKAGKLSFKAHLGLAIAMNAQTPKTLLEKLVHCQCVEVQKTAQLHINVSGEMTSGWDEAARDAIRTTTFTDPLARGFEEYIENLERRDLIPDFALKQLARHQDKNIRSIVGRNSNTPVNLLEDFAQDDQTSSQPLEQLAQDELEQLAQDENVINRWTVASNPNTPLKLLEQLAQDENGIVREAVALHPNTPVSLVLEITLNRYSQDSFLSLSRFLVLLHPQASAKALAENYRSLGWLERYAIAHNSNTPIDTLKTLVVDANRIVRATAKANLQSRNLTRAEAERFFQQAVHQYQSGQLLAAIQYWEQALTIYREIGDRKGQANTSRELGFAFQSLGQYEQAIESHQQAVVINKEMGERSEEAASLINLGVVFASLEQYEQAIEFYQEGLLIAQQIGHRRWAANTLNNLGNAYHSLRQNQEAIEYYQQALILYREIGNRSGEADALSNLGKDFRSLGQYQEAIESLQRSLNISREMGDIRAESTSLDYLGYAYHYLGQHQQALECYQKSLTIVRKIGDRSRQATSLTGLGNAYQSLGQYQQAIEYHQQALAIARKMGDRSGEAASLVNLANPFSSLGQYLQAIELYEQALAIAKEIGMRSWEANALSNLGVAFSELGQYQKAIKFHQESLVTEIQSLLDADTTLVEYFVTETITLAFIITRESFKTVSIEVNWEELSKKIAAFRRFASLKNTHPKSLQQLYEWLIAPLQSWLTTNKLTIVPHNILHYLPFAALSTGERYLCDDYTLTTLPSASILRFLPQKRKPSTGTLLALGNPTTTEPLPSLLSAEKEVNAIASLYGTQPLIGAAATESAVFSQSESAEILHLSVHGEFNKHNPLFSTLHLAADEQHDGRLEVHDIYALDLTKATNLVVLSACQTQLGELTRGDEVVGLNRAFLYAGTPSVIATLWSVQDDTTALLMKRFYTHLRSGIAKAQALRQAQIEVRAEYPHPYYWAAFVLTGDGGSASLHLPSP